MMASTETTSWDLDTLTDAISYHRQPAERRSRSGSGPSLIILCTWMSANRKHIAKYTQQHRRQYPDSELLVIESSVADIIYRTNHTQQRRLRPALDIVLSHITKPKQSGRQQVLLHLFSNGGASSALQLAAGLENYRRTAFSAIVFDSCPGAATYQQAVRAISLSLPKSPMAKYLGVPLIHLMLCLFYLSFLIPGTENMVSRSRRQLNDPRYFSSLVPRVYVYSEADQLVLYQDVKSHVDDAKRNGYEDVKELLFEASGHCAHAMVHKDEYWKAIDNIVQAADQTSQG